MSTGCGAAQEGYPERSRSAKTLGIRWYICGVCTGTHALTSKRAVENALGIAIPDNANCIRNMMQATLHVDLWCIFIICVHALDWVDVVAALKADPHQTSAIAQNLSAWPAISPGYFRDLQNQAAFIEVRSTALSWLLGTSSVKLAGSNLLAVAHYLESARFFKDRKNSHRFRW